MKILAIADMNMGNGIGGLEGMSVLENLQDLDRFIFDYCDDVLDVSFTYYMLPSSARYEDFEEYDDVVDEYVQKSASMNTETVKLILSQVPNQY